MKYGVDDVFYAKSLQNILVLILCEALATQFLLVLKTLTTPEMVSTLVSAHCF